jgi:hypothetical protein
MITKQHKLIKAGVILEEEGPEQAMEWVADQYEEELLRLKRKLESQKRIIFQLMNY